MRHVIGVAGTAKNTGKTTTLQAVARYLRSEGRQVFLTSIGYDGEDLDNVTSLPKPKITVEEGDRIATALPLLQASSAKFTEVEPAGVSCALGPLYTALATSPGKVVVAGPASTRDVAAILDLIPPGCVTLLDGALSRLAPMRLATALVIATGAARSEDPARAGSEIASIAAVMGLPEIDVSRGPTAIEVPGGLFVDSLEKQVAAVLTTQVIHARSGNPGPRVRVSIDGPVNPDLFSRLLRSLESVPVRASFIVGHATDLLLSGDPAAWPAVIAQASRDGHAVFVRQSTSLLGFTVSPFVPRFDPRRGGYYPHLLPARPYLEAVRSAVKSPCTDIVLEGTSTLESWIRPLVFAPAPANV